MWSLTLSHQHGWSELVELSANRLNVILFDGDMVIKMLSIVVHYPQLQITSFIKHISLAVRLHLPNYNPSFLSLLYYLAKTEKMQVDSKGGCYLVGIWDEMEDGIWEEMGERVGEKLLSDWSRLGRVEKIIENELFIDSCVDVYRFIWVVVEKRWRGKSLK